MGWPSTRVCVLLVTRFQFKLTEAYQTVHLKEFTDFPKKDEKDPSEVFTDIHFEKKSIAHEAYHLSHGFYH